MPSSHTENVLLVLGITLTGLYLFRNQLFSPFKATSGPSATRKKSAATNGSSNPRDFVAKMKAGVSSSLILSLSPSSSFSVLIHLLFLP